MSDDVRERSTAWQLGWLAVSGPAVIVVSVALYVLLHAVFMGYLAVLLQLWVLAAVVFGICAVVTGVRDRKRQRQRQRQRRGCHPRRCDRRRRGSPERRGTRRLRLPGRPPQPSVLIEGAPWTTSAPSPR